MKPAYRQLRLRQLSQSLSEFETGRHVVRPHRGWLRALREVMGLSLREVGMKIGATPSHLRALEESEAHERITLQTLKKVAQALDCQLVYAVVPRSGKLEELVEKRAYDQAAKQVRAVEQTMALEDQATGNVEEKIREEAKQILKSQKRTART